MVKSVASVSSARGGGHGTLPSFSSGNTLRDIAANLRHPTQRGVVFGGDLLAGIQIKMYSSTLEWGQKVEESEMHQWREGHFLRCFYKPGRATILQERSEDVTKQLAGRISHGVSTSCLRFEPAKPLWNEMPQSDKDSSAQC